MLSKIADGSFQGLKRFLSDQNQYPFSRKRQLLNRVLSLCSTLRLKSRKENCDIMFILPAPELEARYRHIIDVFAAMNLSCKVVFFSARSMIKLSFKGAAYSDHKIDTDFTVEKAFASYIRAKFAPKLIFQANDSSYLSTFLKHFSGAKLINIAHCVSCSSANFSVLDYHYYFIFGDSSVTNLQNNDCTYGSCQLVKTGSLFLKEPIGVALNSRAENAFEKHIVFSSQWIASGLTDFIEWSRDMVNMLAERNPQWKITVKCHPLETDRSWIKERDNVFIDEKVTDLVELFSDASFHLTHHSAFALESSIFNVPTICIQKNSFKEGCLSLKNYFPVVSDIDYLEQIISGKQNPAFKITEFIKFHLANIGYEMETFKKAIRSILNEESLENVIPIDGTHVK